MVIINIYNKIYIINIRNKYTHKLYNSILYYLIIYIYQYINLIFLYLYIINILIENYNSNEIKKKYNYNKKTLIINN